MSLSSYVLVADTQNRVLLSGLGALTTAAALVMFQGDDALLELHLVVPNPADFNNLTPETAIGPEVNIRVGIGIPGSPSFALANLTTSLAGNLGRSGVITLDTSQIGGFIGNNQSVSGAVIEAEMRDGDGNVTTLFQHPVTLINDLLDDDTGTPTEVSTELGLAIAAAYAAATGANVAATAATSAATVANAAATAATSAAAFANSAGTSATSAAGAANAAAALVTGMTWTGPNGDQITIGLVTGPPLTGPRGPAGTLAGNNGAVVLTGSRDLTPADSGCALYYAGTGAITLTIPLTLADFQCALWQVGADQVEIVRADGQPIGNEWGYTKTRTLGSAVTIFVPTTAISAVAGSMA